MVRGERGWWDTRRQDLTRTDMGGYGRKHDLVTFYTTGKPLPGPSLSEIASAGESLQSRLDTIHHTNVKLNDKAPPLQPDGHLGRLDASASCCPLEVETLWRLKQSWSMQRPENSPWSSPLQRPKVLPPYLHASLAPTLCPSLLGPGAEWSVGRRCVWHRGDSIAPISTCMI